MVPKLQQYVTPCAAIEELVDDETPSYTVRSGGKSFPIYGPGLPESEGESWGRAAYALFTIVNDQLASSEHRLFAINGGNDLAGIFLTPAQAEEARGPLSRKLDWPYMPTNQHPWYGQHH